MLCISFPLFSLEVGEDILIVGFVLPYPAPTWLIAIEAISPSESNVIAAVACTLEDNATPSESTSVGAEIINSGAVVYILSCNPERYIC